MVRIKEILYSPRTIEMVTLMMKFAWEDYRKYQESLATGSRFLTFQKWLALNRPMQYRISRELERKIGFTRD